MKTQNTLWAVVFLAMLITPAWADRNHYDGHYDNRFEQRQDRQHWRIKQGIRSGELTRKEAKRLHRQQRRLEKLANRFADDGYLDRQERRELRRRLNAASDRIYRLKHNDRYRFDRKRRHERYSDYNHEGYLGRKHHDSYQVFDDSHWSITFSLWDRL
jgi:hypothetical protein